MIGATMVVATLPVSDLEQAKAFYGGTLGLTFLWETPASVRFRCGDSSELSTLKRPGLAAEHTLAHFRGDGHRGRGRRPRGEGRRVHRLHGGTTRDDGPHRATWSRAWRVVPRPRREHPRPPSGVAP